MLKHRHTVEYVSGVCECVCVCVCVERERERGHTATLCEGPLLGPAPLGASHPVPPINDPDPLG